MIARLAGIATARLRRGSGLPSPPALMTYNVTHRCNARCSMCDIHNWDSAAESELTAARYGEFIRDHALRGLEVVRITGGEPFLREDLPEIFRHTVEATRCGIFYVTTNGLLPGRVAALVESASAESRKLHIQVSLDALTDLHDSLRGVPGAKDRAVETLRRLAELKRKYNFHAGINQTIMKSNLGLIAPVHSLAEELGLGHSLFLCAGYHEGKQMGGRDTGGGPVPFRLQEEMSAGEIEAFYRIHRELKSNGAAVRARRNSASAFLRDISEEYLNEGGRNRLLNGAERPKPPCMAFFNHFRMLPDGRIVPCSVMRGESAGSVAEAPFAEIWRGARAAEIRKKVLGCKGCWIECDINPSVFYSGDIVTWFVRRAATDAGFRKRYLSLRGSN